MSDLLGLGAQAVSAYRTALTAIGENVANAQTPGYARREVRLREVRPVDEQSIFFHETLQFGGVRADAITRAWDNFRATDARITAAAAGRAEARATWLGAVEDALDDGPAGPGTLMGKFFTSGLNLAANPDDTLGRRSMLMSLEDTANAFRTTADSLSRVSEGLSGTAKLEIDGLNQDLAALSRTNDAIRKGGVGTASTAALHDDRDRLLDSIAKRVDISVSLDAKGVANVTMSGSAGSVLVDGGRPSIVTLAVATDGRLSYTLHMPSSTAALPVTGGTLAGLSDAAALTADRRAELDSIAQDFTAAVNGWSAQGRTANGNPGGALLEAPNGAASMRLLTSDPAAIAAASAEGTANGNLLALNSLRGGDGGETRWAGLVAAHALMVASAKSESSAAASRRDNSFAARDEITGVDLDQEAAELMRYQQAYNGATRIIQVARETMQQILDLF